MRPLVYDSAKGYIKDNTSEEFAKHWKHINELLEDEKSYLEEAKKDVVKLLPHYMEQFSRGGFITGLLQKVFVKGFVEGLLGQGFFIRIHALNNIQCESHRWAILRTLNKKR